MHNCIFLFLYVSSDHCLEETSFSWIQNQQMYEKYKETSHQRGHIDDKEYMEIHFTLYAIRGLKIERTSYDHNTIKVMKIGTKPTDSSIFWQDSRETGPLILCGNTSGTSILERSVLKIIKAYSV